MNFFNELQNIKNQNLYREFNSIQSPQGRMIEIQGEKYLNFSSNNYLNLANHEDLKKAVINGIAKWGVGAGASRLISGNMEPYQELELVLSAFQNKEKTLVFNSGYSANLGVLTALAGKDDIIFIDRLNHASIIDGVKLSGAKMVVYHHCDMNDLEKKLKQYQAKNRFIITDTVFSMDGDLAPLKDLCDFAKKFNALLIADEAHGFGVFGKNGEGLVHHYGLQNKVDIIMGTLSKSAGIFGAYISAEKNIIDLIRNKARSLIYTTALPPAFVEGAIKSIELIKNSDNARAQLWENINYFKIKFSNIHIFSQIIPFMIAGNENVLKKSNDLKQRKIFAPAIRFPSVKKGQERLRISLMSAHTRKDLDQLIEALI